MLMVRGLRRKGGLCYWELEKEDPCYIVVESLATLSCSHMEDKFSATKLDIKLRRFASEMFTVKCNRKTN